MPDPFVYDKAKYHYGGNYPEDLPDDQAFVHTGLYLGWIIDNDLYSEMFRDESAELITRFKAREITGPEVYESWDGCLIDYMLSDDGNAFSRAYFDFERGSFLQDYDEVLGSDYPSLYHVPNTWENYDRLRARLDERYTAWRRSA
ncbi:MAG TPA: hypothetical protein VFP26_01770 [Gemmatimonadaceae bacterium]|jgi:hypothetical protein|nr:hypothetical protein [Gemmatimonadaceae bacterium]